MCPKRPKRAREIRGSVLFVGYDEIIVRGNEGKFCGGHRGFVFAQVVHPEIPKAFRQYRKFLDAVFGECVLFETPGDERTQSFSPRYITTMVLAMAALPAN